MIIKIFLQEDLTKVKGCAVVPQFHGSHGTARTKLVQDQASMDKEGLMVSPLAEKPLAVDGFQVGVKLFSSGVWSLAGYSCTNITQQTVNKVKNNNKVSQIPLIKQKETTTKEDTGLGRYLSS